jgi:hypothetical protein
MKEKGDFIVIELPYFALQMRTSLILVANEDYISNPSLVTHQAF